MTEKDYGLVTDPQVFLEDVRRIIDSGKSFGFDIETGYDGPKTDDVSVQAFNPRFKVVGFSYSDDVNWARYVPLAHDDSDNAPLVPMVRLLWRLLQSGNGVAHNLMFELQGLARLFRDVLWDDTFYGEAVRSSRGYYPFKSDTMIEAFMTQRYQPLGAGRGVGVGLKGLVKHVFHHDQRELKTFFEDKKTMGTLKQLRFNILPLSKEVIDYACEDAAWCLALHEMHYPEVKDQFLFKVEMQLMPVLCDMEWAGLALDWDEYEARSVEIASFLDAYNEQIQQDLSERLGEPVNVNLGSSQQVAELLYDKLGLPEQYDPKTKRRSTSEVAMRELVRQNPFLKDILEWREVKKLLSSYINKYKDQLHYTERAHPNHKQTGAATGRMSVDGVSYQQWPKPYHYELKSGRTLDLNYRNFLISPKGFRIVGYDFSQVELRVLAGMANEKALLEAFNSGVDIHSATASTMMKIPLEEVTEKLRANGKTLNFAVVYGSGADNIGTMLGVTKAEAQQMLDDYFAAFSGLRGWMDDRVLEGQQNGVVYTQFGRKFKVWEYVDAAEMHSKAMRMTNPPADPLKFEEYMEQREKFIKMSRIARSKGDRMCVNAPVQGGAADYMKIGMVRAHKAIKKAGLEDKVILVMTIHDALEFYVHESVSTQEVIDLISPQVTFPVEGFPAIRADWHEGVRWGEVVEIELDSDQKISGYVWKKKHYDSIEEAYFAQANPEKTKEKAPELPKAEELSGIVISLPDLPTQEEWQDFKEWLATKDAGKTRISLKFPLNEKTLNTTAMICNTDIESIKKLLSEAEVTGE